jgi:hypothetical protein
MEFKQKIQNSFKKARADFDALRVSFIDWINYFRYSQSLVQKRIEALEARVRELEEERRILVTTY